MKKILFWLDAEMIHFPIAKFMQENIDAELSAVLDVPLPLKKFFKKQKIVDFSKKWFYRDNVSVGSTDFDMTYLKEFEKKYHINLWEVAFNERNFYRYQKFHKFSKNEILSILEQECRFFESIFENYKPDYFLLKLYSAHHLHLLYLMCKKKQIPTLVLFPTRLTNRSIISTAVDKIDELECNSTINSFEDSEKSKKALNEKILKKQKSNVERWNYNESTSKKILQIIKFILQTNHDDYTNYFPNYKKTPLNYLKRSYNHIIERKKIEKFFKKNALTNIPQQKFVFFPLHVEPERTISIDASFSTNQVEIIHQIAKSLPIDYMLFVKEHPVQFTGPPKKLSFYQNIIEMPNVKLFHSSVSSLELMKKCEIVTTINGTVGFECQFYGKPTIVFGNPIYSNLPLVQRCRNFYDLPNIIKKSLTLKPDPQAIKSFEKLYNEKSFNFSWDELSLKISKEFFHGGFSGENEIDENHMNHFIDDNSEIFQYLSSQYIKKIYKKPSL
jgi:hypothetical protein